MDDIQVPKELLAYVPIMWILLAVIKQTAGESFEKIKRLIPLACIVIGVVIGLAAPGYEEGTAILTKLMNGIILGWSPLALNETIKSVIAKK